LLERLERHLHGEELLDVMVVDDQRHRPSFRRLHAATNLSTVMPAHSASKTRVNALKSRASTSFLLQARRGWPGRARP
jgi:hypothetical protein